MTTPAKRPILQRIRNRMGAMLAEGALEGLASAGKMHPALRREMQNIEVLSNIPYSRTGMREHLLDVVRTKNRKDMLAPTVLYVHGGAFRILSKETHWGQALAFARKGYVVFNINYRLAPKHPFPAALEDVSTALQWVYSHAEQYGADPKQIIFAGESAGANLITSLTITTCWQRPERFARKVFDKEIVPKAIIPMCGIYQVSDIARFRKKNYGFWLMDRLEEVGQSYLSHDTVHHVGAFDLADPVVFFEHAENAPVRPLPPALATVGTKDPLLDDTRRLERAYKRHGGRIVTGYYAGEIHAFQAMLWRPQAQHFWRATYAFLDEHLHHSTRRP